MKSILQSLPLIFLFIVVSCSPDPLPHNTNQVIKDEYPDVAQSVVERNSDELFGFTSHTSEEVRSLAWRAIAKSDVADAHQLLERVIESNEPAAWLALSFQPQDESGMEAVRNLFSDDPGLYYGACELFRQQGGSSEFSLILDRLDEAGNQFQCAVAAGTIASRVEVEDDLAEKLVEAAMNSEHSEMSRNLLYGFYRSPLNRPEHGTGLREKLAEGWDKIGVSTDPELDQYMIRILGDAGFRRYLNAKGSIRAVENPRILIEGIQAMTIPENLSEEEKKLYRGLLTHKNPHVVVQTFEKFRQSDLDNGELVDFIYQNIASSTRNHELFIASMEFLNSSGADLSGLQTKLEFIEKENRYLTNRILNLYRVQGGSEAFLNRVESHLEAGGIRGLHAAQVLTEFWIDQEDESMKERIHGMVRAALEQSNRSVLSGLNTLMTDETLIADDDYSWIQSAYAREVEENVRENINALEQVLESRFPERYEQISESEDPNFRIPDWDRLYELGTRPVWRLETNKGIIEVRLDPLTAPFTVSSIDSLTRAGLYDDVAFHRVVRNFVVQGGDFDRRDGFGSPDYTLPTEPSLGSFKRGAVGVASSGTDTEGSQFFFMHQWAPHLDGSYTNFGHVIRGMDVVDLLQIGDRVKRASVSVR